MRVEKVEWVGFDAVITVSVPTWFGFGKPYTQQFRGSGTVWHDAETGRRQPTHIEGWLADVWTKAKWSKQSFVEKNIE